MLRMIFDDVMKSRLIRVSKSRLVLRCPKHPRYNPAEGQGAIKGSCDTCRSALIAYDAVLSLRQAVACYLINTENYETSKPRTRKVKGATA